ncbi:hypothetical protein ACQFYA_20995 [Promicromonospora sp. Marseille-Q5078]
MRVHAPLAALGYVPGMSRYTFQDALPLAGSSAALVTAAIEAAYPMPLPKLAKAAGVSRFAATRAVETAREAGIMLQDDMDLWEFNDDHELADLLCDLAWRFSGVRRGKRPDSPWWSDWRRSGSDWSDEYRYREIIPGSLLEPTDDDPAARLPGPDLATVRAFIAWAPELIGAMRQFEYEGQSVFSLWRNERLRDMVHQTLHFGSPLARAIELMREVANADAQGEAAPHDVTVTARDWAQAVYLLSADARDLVRVLRILQVAIREAGLVHSKRDLALSRLEQIDRLGSDDNFNNTRLQEALDAATEARTIWRADDAELHYKNIGGSPVPVDVGTAGDKIYAVRMERLAGELVEKVNEMAAHPAFAAWVGVHPEDAARFPLVAEAPNLQRDQDRERDAARS